MAAVTFDTFKFIKTLKEAGLLEPQAEAICAAVRDSHETAELATKTDLREYESAIRGDLEKLEGRLNVKHEALRHEISDVRHEMDAKHEALRHEIGDVRKDMDAKHEALRHEMKALGLRLTIWLGSIVFVAVNAGPIISKLLHLF